MAIAHHTRRLFPVLISTSFILLACQPGSPTAVPATKTATVPTAKPSLTATATSVPTPASTATPALAAESDFIKGVWFADWGLGEGVATVDGKGVLRDVIRPLGANWVALQVPCHMDASKPNVIRCNADNTMPDAVIADATKTAHSLGLRVALLPFVLDVTGVADGWVNNLNFGSSAHSWSMYFEAYAEQLQRYARLAEKHQIDMLIIGVEQTGAQTQEQHWRSLISQVREVYHGAITYGAYCQHFKSVNWWDAVDYIGINFYCFPLSNSANPTYEEVKKQYTVFLEMIKSGTSKWQKPVIFTEIGYQSVNGVARIVPFGVRPVRLDVEEQGLLAHGFIDAVKEFGNEDRWLKGLFWYNYTSNPLLGGSGDINFTPHNKPAETYLKSFYTGEPLEALPTPVPHVEEDQIVESYWLFHDQLENNVRLAPSWGGTVKHAIVADPLGERGDVIAVRNIDQGQGFRFEAYPAIEFRSFDFIELYLYAPAYEPNLPISFEDYIGRWVSRWVYIRSFIDHEPLLDKHWHRIQIPVDTLFPPDRFDFISNISFIYFVHNWPGQPGPITFYMDDVRVIKTK